MSYYEDVYVKRLNKEGYTQQERIKTKKEKEFDMLILKKSQYQANIYQVNENKKSIICSLQPNKWNESELISNLFLSRSVEKFKTGDILRIFQKIGDIEYDKIWLVLFKEENITQGYETYKVVCLDNIINITNEYGDTIYCIPVKFVSATSSIVEDYFAFGTRQTYREPNKDVRLITSDFDFLKKDVYFEYKGRGWEITGKDNISINGVAYVSISERLLSEVEPKSSGQIEVGNDTNFFLNNR